MKTQMLPVQSKSNMLALTNILVPLALLPPSAHASKNEEMMEAATESLAARLRRHPFLAGMNQRQLELLKNCASAASFQKEQVIFREGEPADRFYLIETGKVKLESSAGLGDHMLGWSWMFPPHTWRLTARAVEPTTAIFFDGTTLREHCEKDHSFGYELLKRLSLSMYHRMQARRNKVLATHQRRTIVNRRAASFAYGGARSLVPSVRK